MAMNYFEELKRRNVFRVGIAYGVAAWLLIQVTDTVFPRIGLPDSAVTLVIALLAIGFIPALIFAWAFEMTPEGIKKEAEVDRAESITPNTGKKLDRVIIGIMAAVIVFLLVDRFVLNTGETRQKTENPETSAQVTNEEDAPPSVAVLPFVNMSGNADNEYFSDGLTETLLHMLAQLPELRVAARTSSFAFKGQQTSVTEIADSLGVAHILEGSVQRAGDRVRVTAQLIRAEDGFHVWSQNYDRTLEDIFAIQDEIATDVVTALDASLLGGESITSVATHNVDAYDLYLKALEQQAIFSYSSLAEADSLLKQSLAQDPDFIDAKLSLARNYIMMNGTGLIEIEETAQRTLPLLDQVDQVQPGNPVARAFRLLLQLDQTSEGAGDQRQATIDELSTLLTAIPTETYMRAMVAAWLSNFYNESERALQLTNAGLLVDPLSAFLHARKGDVLTDMERYDEARLSMLRAIEIQPGYASAYNKMAIIMADMGDMQASLDWTRKSIETDPQDHELAAALARILYELKLPEEGDRYARRVSALAPGSDVDRMTRLLGHFAHGEMAQAEETARSMILEQVSPRQGAIWEAVFAYQQMLSSDDREEDALELLHQARPDIVSYESLPKDQAGMAMQWAAALLIHQVSGPARSVPLWDKFVSNLDASGARWHHEDPLFRITRPLFSGDMDEAVKIALEDSLSAPVAQWVVLNDVYRTPVFEPVSTDPRVAARLAERQREFEQIRREVIAMLQGPEWQ